MTDSYHIASQERLSALLCDLVSLGIFGQEKVDQ